MSTTMPFKTDPATSPSKSKMAGEMLNMAAAKQNHRVSFDVCIEKRSTDGNPKVYCKLNQYGIYAIVGNGSSAIPEESTNVTEFANKVRDLIISAGSAV